MSSSSWQDRRFMFPAGKQVHEGSAGYTPAEKETPPTVIPTSTTTASGSPPAAKVLPSWDGDRRFMFPSGKQVHEPGRRLSGSSGTSGKAVESTAKAASPPPASSSPQTAIANAIAGRRRVRPSPIEHFFDCGLFDSPFADHDSYSHLRPPKAECSAASWHDAAVTNTMSAGRAGKT